MKMKRILCFLLSLLMVIGMAACAETPEVSDESSSAESTESSDADSSSGGEDGKWPSYLNLESQYPIVKEGESITLSMVTIQQDGYGSSDPNEYWFFAWAQEKMNITLDIEMIQSSAYAERKPLMFAGGDLADVLVALGLSASDLVTYGETNKQLMDMSSYIDEDLTPNICAWFNYYPTLKASASCSDGGLYTLPGVGSHDDLGGTAARYFINKAWLDDAGLESPSTLDEFIDMLRAFKERDPDSIPMGGGYGSDSAATSASAPNPSLAVLNALGYITNDPYGLTASLRNGEVVIPAGDEHYLDFLTVMKTCYDEGLISPDFFTMDTTQFNAMALEDKFGAMGSVPYLHIPEKFDEWESISPLTSDLNSTKQWYNSDFFSIGNFSISSTCAYPEAAMRLGDWFFTAEGDVHSWSGPMTDGGETMDMCGGWYVDEDKVFKYKDVVDGLYGGSWDYIISEIVPSGGFNGVGNNTGSHIEDQETNYKYRWEWAGYPEYARPLDPTNGDGHFRITQMEKLADYVVGGYPTKVYFSEATNTRLGDLSSVINSYIRSETAKFITGTRSLDEFDAYLAELETLGFSECLGNYADYYKAYLANIG